MHGFGINIGSTSVKAVLCHGLEISWSQSLPHEGNVPDTLQRMLGRAELPAGLRAMVTGNEGRHLVKLPAVIESLCVEEALGRADHRVEAVVSMGGEDLIVYRVDEQGSIVTNFSGNKCAAGTGEFFKQQLGRMDMKLEDIHSLPADCRVMKLSARCSVFMKSDCTHRLNKGEATAGDIVVSLANVMAIKVVDFLKRARIVSGRVLLAGGVTCNQHILGFLREKLPEVEFLVPEEAPFFEAYGAALLAQSMGAELPPLEKLTNPLEVGFARFNDLNSARDLVEFIPSRKSHPRPGREYILGVDGGSTTTKVCLIDTETLEVAASHYGRTHGDPVRALKNCIAEVKQQLRAAIGDSPITISLAATTGSSREILGVFLETPGVYNEIIAHSVGTTYFHPDIDTIFEIGGQDAKYVLLKNKVPIDYAMNEACSAGTGSFLEESAQGDLNIDHAWQIGEIALRAERPLKFGEHCSAFINSDIRKAIQQNASREDITAGLVTSIVSNYLNRVVGNRTIGSNIVLQGGVAKNEAVPLAFAMLLGKKITVPPDPELMGCFGVGLLARQKLREGLLERQLFDLDGILATEMEYERTFQCKACDNYCPIRVLKVNQTRYMFGGRCDKYANRRKKRRVDENEVVNYIEEANRLLFEEFAPRPDDLRPETESTVGVPRCFTVYALWPFYSWYFHHLGVRAELSDRVLPDGLARVESAYCFPAEIGHGAVQDVLDKGYDYIFLPHTRDMESFQGDVHACFCPLTQGLPYYIDKAFPELPAARILAPVVSFKYGRSHALKPFVELGLKLGFPPARSEAAFDKAWNMQREYWAAARRLGTRALEEARRAKRPVMAILGRPYNAFTPDANMGIPRKFTSRGCSVVPFDILPFEDEEIFDNMYWFHGQQNMLSAMVLKKEDNIFATYISNFSCAPDSFMLHYLKWIMGTKPFLVLELDSHTADAGVDTRVEAFLDIIDGYRAKLSGEDARRFDHGWRFFNGFAGSNGQRPDSQVYLHNEFSGEKVSIHNNPRVKILLSNMGRLATELLAASLRCGGISSEALPMADTGTLNIARQYVSGKECLPSHLVLGGALRYFASDRFDKDLLYLLFVPETTGPCRTGQYRIFYENLFRDLELPNVVVMTLGSDNSYNELGPHFSKHAWWGLIVSDYMKDVETSLRACAEDPVAAMARYDELWQELVNVAESEATGLLPALEKIAGEIARIPLKRNPADCPKVLVVGEIYVRRDDFAVDELIQLFSQKGVIAKVSGIGEWIYYCDFGREYELKKRLRLMPWYRRPFSADFRSLVGWNAEQVYKHSVERKVKRALAPTGLVPETPHEMDEIMRNCEEHFVNHELESEIAISSGVAATAMLKGFSGIVNISPFACLIGRVIEGVLAPWARERHYPMISVEIDGNQLPPTTISKLEIFMLNVLRFQRRPDVGELLECAEDKAAIVDRRIVRR